VYSNSTFYYSTVILVVGRATLQYDITVPGTGVRDTVLYCTVKCMFFGCCSLLGRLLHRVRAYCMNVDLYSSDLQCTV